MSDIVKRLKLATIEHADRFTDEALPSICDEAASEIERLRDERDTAVANAKEMLRRVEVAQAAEAAALARAEQAEANVNSANVEHAHLTQRAVEAESARDEFARVALGNAEVIAAAEATIATLTQERDEARATIQRYVESRNAMRAAREAGDIAGRDAAADTLDAICDFVTLKAERDALRAERDALADAEAKSAGHHLARIASLDAALAEARAELDSALHEICELRGKIPTQQPDRGGRLVLNAYGRACYTAGQESQQAALTEARRVLRLCEPHVEDAMNRTLQDALARERREVLAQITAVLAQEVTP